MFKIILYTLISLSVLNYAYGSQKNIKGLIPELTPPIDDLSSADEDRNLKGEIMISRTEKVAIKKLKQLIKKTKPSHYKASLLFRLAELYMRRSKSGRFFDLHRDKKGYLRIAKQFHVGDGSKHYLNQAIQIYTSLYQSYPKYDKTDFVVFNNAFAHQQLKNNKKANEFYSILLSRFSQSLLVPDALLAMGELHFIEHKFKTALNYYNKARDKFSEAGGIPLAIVEFNRA